MGDNGITDGSILVWRWHLEVDVLGPLLGRVQVAHGKLMKAAVAAVLVLIVVAAAAAAAVYW